jgi:hypothetical protein
MIGKAVFKDKADEIFIRSISNDALDKLNLNKWEIRN